MSGKIEISREQLQRWEYLLDSPSKRQELLGELRALIAAPVVERQEPIGFVTRRDGRYGAWLHSSQRQAENFDSTAINGKPGNSEILAVYTSPPAPVAVVQQCKIGIYGKAYDAPETKRAYTYEDQPDNLGAHKLGQAAIAASLTRGGDLIDSGLSLLRSLYGEGFGVFEIDACLDKVKELNQ